MAGPVLIGCPHPQPAPGGTGLNHLCGPVQPQGLWFAVLNLCEPIWKPATTFGSLSLN